MLLSAFTQAILKATDEAELFAAFKTYVAKFGADIISYHLLVENLRHLSREMGSVYTEAPEAWRLKYRENDYFDGDPIMAAGVKAREPFHWFDAGQIIDLTPKQKNYLADLRGAGAIDGVCIPIHGGLGTAGMMAVGSTTQEMPLKVDERVELMSACYQLHNRWMEMRGEKVEGPPLSKRETQVLTLVAQGKTNSAIADILGVSEHTIDTLVRRSFVKLGVTDRISAALKAVGMGKVQI